MKQSKKQVKSTVWNDGGLAPTNRVEGLRLARSTNGSGETIYRVHNKHTQTYESFRSRKDAVRHYEELARTLLHEGTSFVLTKSERAALALWRNHREKRLKASKTAWTLEQAIQLAIQQEDAQDEVSPLISTAAHDYINHLERKGRNTNYITTTKTRLELALSFFADGTRLACVDDKTAAACLSYTRKEASNKHGSDISAETMHQYIMSINALWRWCQKMKWVQDNPFNRVRDTVSIATSKQKKVPGKEYTDRQSLERMLNWTRENHPRMLACLVLLAFCGLRPTEAQRLRWRNIVIESDEVGAVHITAIPTKTDRSRIVKLCPAGIAWWKLAKEAAGMPAPDAHIVPARSGDDSDEAEGARRELWSKHTTRLKEQCPPTVIPGGGTSAWPRDLLRHSYGTYYRAKTGSLAQTAEQMGNTETVCRQHYSTPVAQKDGVAYFDFFPKVSKK